MHVGQNKKEHAINVVVDLNIFYSSQDMIKDRAERGNCCRFLLNVCK